MNPTHFEQVTNVLERPDSMTDEECGPLPIFRENGTCISLWRMSLRERISALFFGRVWVWVYSGKTQPPISLSAERNIFEVEDD